MSMVNLLKKKYTGYQKPQRKRSPDFIQRKCAVIGGDYDIKKRLKRLKNYYKSLPIYKQKWKYRLFVRHLAQKKIKNKLINFARWILIDTLRGKSKKVWGIYQFVALPGEGKTMSMVAHIERFRNDMKSQELPYVIATNFNYKYQNYKIEHWLDIVKISKECYRSKTKCLIAMDEIHVTFDSSDWKSFPAEMLALLSFNRKYELQFLCSSQIYDRIPKKIRDIANFTVICKNFGNLDRYFKNYYFSKDDYEEKFNGQRRSAKFIRTFVADDTMYSLYDTLEQVEKMTEDAKKEQTLKEQAFNILFGNSQENESETIPA